MGDEQADRRLDRAPFWDRWRSPLATRSVIVAILVGIALIAAGSAFALTRSPARVVQVGVQGGPESPILQVITGDMALCQTGEVLPAGVSGIRLSLWAFFGPPVRVIAYKGSQVLTEGQRGANWTSDSVTVPVKPLSSAAEEVRLCVLLPHNSEGVLIRGVPTSPSEAAVVVTGGAPTPALAVSRGHLIRGRLGAEYIAADQGTWLSRVGSVIEHMGFGRAFTGSWVSLLIVAVMAAVSVLAVRLALRELP